jgi:hypothetical protein
MSKAEGKNIAIKFTEPLVGAEATEHFRAGESYLPVGTVTASSQYSSYAPTRAFDGSASYYWRASTYPCWIQIELAEAVAIAGFRWDTQTTSYRPKDFTVQGSNNGTDWTTIYSGQSPAEYYWKEFTWDITNDAYKFYRWDISTLWSSRIQLYGIELFAVESYFTNGNETAFEVKGNVPDYVEFPSEELGPLTEKIFIVDNVIPHPTESSTILLTMKDVNEFKNVDGNLSVSYNASLGDLAGLGGAVSSFTEVFTPTNLVRIPNPFTAETLDVSVTDLDIDLIQIYYKDGYKAETIDVSITDFSVDLINIGDLDP